MSRAFVALVGRPNVGKSTLFNRLVGERISVVDDAPGTTRDRIQAPVEWGGISFTLVDTGGIEPLETLRDRSQTPLAESSRDFVYEIRQQAETAIADADVILFVADAQSGLTAIDEAVADILRKQIGLRGRSGKAVPPVLVVASKAEAQGPKAAAMELYGLGLGEVFAVSGIQGDGTGDLLDAIVAAIRAQRAGQAPDVEDESVRIALVGRPNVGKSSLFNALVGEPRVIVSDVPGTTRDAIDTVIDFEERTASPEGAEAGILRTRVTLVDTAGMRKRGAIEPGVEKFSVLRSMKALSRADVGLLLIDAHDGITAQDEHIAGYILDEAKSVVLLVNKWDMVESAERVARIAKHKEGWGMLTEKMERFLEVARERFNFMAYSPIMFMSAKTGFRVQQVLPTALRANEARSFRVATSDVMRIVREASEKHAAPTRGGRRLKIYFASQVGINPPTFVLNVNDTQLAHFSYRRFIENRIRDEFGFLGTPMNIIFKGHSERG
ncbi:MAG TPA: ribosome biogenesis GTPase Der [Thermoflexales bacterium]|nr:ribosome biogenesis GTPase Der [Thermoflexales bacterium]HQX09691.1 ribosome biogenesis GTPase Der [Thermoflexales bacterium]HQY26831.1 ribosome biogenesis GTPase Der [Thermoflexales bacterium]HQZ52648.1 ribosome biogenesis GTPase Der [Thermoflexales bacterium]HRA52868.1 ribosome biogenesis GTPase Der [Thermoflexales bacterium]